MKLFAFSRKIRNANRSIEAISKDIATTGAVLQRLGVELNKDENARLCSSEPIRDRDAACRDNLHWYDDPCSATGISLCFR
jgi:hypothetical protein